MRWKHPLATFVVAVIATGCVFHFTSLRLDPSTLVPVVGNLPEQFTLSRNVKISLNNGFTTWLLAGTRWQEAGTITYGKVFNTGDQSVIAPVSDAYSQAGLVVSNQVLVGLYLIAENAFTPVRSPPLLPMIETTLKK